MVLVKNVFYFLQKLKIKAYQVFITKKTGDILYVNYRFMMILLQELF